MLQDPEKEIKRMARFLELPVDSYMLDSIINKTSLDSMRSHSYQYHPYPPEVMDPNHQTNLFRNGKLINFVKTY